MACCNTHYGLSAVLKAGYSDLLLYRYLRLTEKNGAAGGQFCAFIQFYLREEHEILILFINTGRTVPVDYKHQICYSFC